MKIEERPPGEGKTSRRRWSKFEEHRTENAQRCAHSEWIARLNDVITRRNDHESGPVIRGTHVNVRDYVREPARYTR